MPAVVPGNLLAHPDRRGNVETGKTVIEADYVVVGAGSAGCVVAARLSEDGARVVLLEAGPPDTYPFIHVPAGFLKLIQNPRVNWNYLTEPEPGTGNRPHRWPRGRVLGGTSSINGMLWVRGQPADYDGWAQRGCQGWSYEEVLPHFRRSERYAAGDDAVRGRDGPVTVEDHRTVHPLAKRFVEAAQQAGWDYNPDYNSGDQEGASFCQMSRRGRFRASTARTYLAEAKGRPNLRVETRALASRLIFEGRRCTGVAFRRDGVETVVRAARAVILSGGTINSPHLLQISGVGPAAHLGSLGVQPVHDLPGVGANLHDHYIVRVSQRVRGAVTVNEQSRGLRLVGEVLQWTFGSRGVLTLGATNALLFCRSREGLMGPDLQLSFAPGSFAADVFGVLEKEPGMTIAVCPVRPESRGTVMAISPDPSIPASIRPNYLSAPNDLEVIRAGIRLSRKIFSMPALAPLCVQETFPGPDVQTDDDMERYARGNGGTVYHPVGTCRMGTDPMAVVDPRLRVHGIDGLRVADASIIPAMPSGNTNAPTIMIGEKCAAMIREDARAPL